MPVMDGYETLAALKADDDPARPAGHRHLRRRRAGQRRPLHRHGRHRLPAQDGRPGDPARPVAASLAQKRLRDNEHDLLATIDRQRSQLARFLSPQVAALVSSADGEAMLTGHRREITAMFCDLRNFTGFSEVAEPEEVIGFLRDYHASMGRLIVEHEGTLEHFAGDGFMTFFNDPVIQADHASRAIGLAVAMRDRFAPLAEDWRRRGHVLELGIGIATGYATLGRIGFEGRYDYGAIGNVIILASRLSGEAGPGEILVSQRTYAQAEAAGRGRARGRADAQGLQPGGADLHDQRSRARRGRRMTLDPSAMARLLEITGDDVEFVDELVDTFLDDAGTQVEALRAAAAADDAEAAVRPAHSLKSSSTNVGATRLADLTRAIETDGRGGAVPDLAARVGDVETELEAVREALLAERAGR